MPVPADAQMTRGQARLFPGATGNEPLPAYGSAA